MRASPSSEHDDVLVIEPGRDARDYFRELWRHRELFQVFAWRDFSVRYKQTLLGIGWAVLRPFVAMVAFTWVFGRIAKLSQPSQAPYALMVFTGLLPWQFFATSLSEASNSIVANAGLVTRSYFPRLILPAASVVIAGIDLALGFAMLALLMLYYGFVPPLQLVLLPLFVLLAILASLGPGLWITALNVKYRDFRFVVPFIVQVGLYVSPVGFSSTLVPERFRTLYGLNPMVSVIDGFRYCILGSSQPLDWSGVGLGVVMSALLLWLGLGTFRRLERSFADLV